MKYLPELKSRADLCALSEAQTADLCTEIRSFLIDNVSQTGGHLASNLGVVELTVAIHRVFDTSKDRLVFDVGHQSYIHKLLTGRADLFPTLRKFRGMAGFPKPSESVHDAFIAGHASDSVSVALGMARARSLNGDDYSVIALMGDGALTGGLAYEGLNDAGASREPLIVILNDNGMSITPNVGGMARHLSNIRTRQSYFRIKKTWRAMTRGTKVGRVFYRWVHRMKESLKHRLIGSNMFNDMGFEYIGPVDGHDLKKITYLLREARDMNCPVILHVLTKKGKGFQPAEENPDLFHGVGPFDRETGLLRSEKKPTFSDWFGESIVKLAQENDKICAITAAMQSGTGLDEFARLFPKRFGDAGIAEGHAVSMAAGLAKQGMIPVVAIYSTFLQRAFDMLIHDVAILGLHVVFAVDRAGLVGADGETHHGIFDVGYLRLVPGMQILCPANRAELISMLRKAIFDCTGPVAIRYPRGGEGRWKEASASSVLRAGTDLTLCAYGTTVNSLLDAADLLHEQGIEAEVIQLRQIKPLADDWKASVQKTGSLLMVEECPSHCGVFDELAADPAASKIHKRVLDLGLDFPQHGSNSDLLCAAGLDADSIAAAARLLLKEAGDEA